MLAPEQMSQLWQRTLDILKTELSNHSFDTWMRYTRLINYQDKNMVILVPNEFAKEWLESRYYNLIKNTLQLLVNHDVEIEFVSTMPENTYVNKEDTRTGSKRFSANEDASSLNTSNLNPRYTFDTFVVGNSNRFAHAAALAVSEAPAKAYNPLFIYGGVGLGKTHLMHAIGQHVLKMLPRYKVMYVSSEKFTNELINAIRDDKTEEFRTKYRNIDVLLVDDIQFLAGKERTQEEFFHTFNALHEAVKQIIISSDRPPKEIPTLEDRLRSRFEWGLITDIQPPDLETRIAILRKKARLENVNLPNEIMLFIANNIQSNIRELEGALIRISAYSSLTNKRIDEETVAEALKDMITISKPRPITIPLIQDRVANYFGLRVEDFKAKRRDRAVSFPRQIAMYLCRELTDSSLPQIGKEFGGRDHTTVIHAHEKISNLFSSETYLEKTINEIISHIQPS